MAKIHVCDVCKSEGKLTETRRYFSVKGKPMLRIDVCPVHNDKVKKMGMTEYKIFVYKVVHNVTLLPETAKTI